MRHSAKLLAQQTPNKKAVMLNKQGFKYQDESKWFEKRGWYCAEKSNVAALNAPISQ